MKIFGDRLTQLLNENHLSQTEFAQKINATAPTVSKYCSGRVPNGEIVKQIADFFNVEPACLLKAPSSVVGELMKRQNWMP